MQGWFIDPQGNRMQLVAGNAREFRTLVHRKLTKQGWKRASDSPFVPPLEEDDIEVGIGPTPVVAAPNVFPAPTASAPVETPSTEDRAAAVAEALGKPAKK
jgi:hypothetical protein